MPCGALAAVTARSAAADDRRVWEYTGEFGPSWFVHEGGEKWVIYRGDGRTFLYVEERRTDESVELRGPYTKLRGTTQEIAQQLPADLLAPGLEPRIEVFVSDNGGNVTRVTRSVSGMK